MMKHSSRQFGDQFSGFGRQSEKFSRIGACIRRNFMPCNQLYFFCATCWKLNWSCVKDSVVSN